MISRGRPHLLAALLLLAGGILTACTPNRDPDTLFAPDAVGVLVIDAALIVDQPLPRIRLSRTLAPDAPYSAGAAVERDANMVIRTDAAAYVYEYFTLGGGPGGYFPTAVPTPIVVPGTRYELEVTTQAGEVLTAGTTTPGRFAIDAWVLLSSDGQTSLRTLQTFATEGDAVFDHPDNQLAYAEGLLDGRYSGAGAATYGAEGFQLAIFSLDRDSALVIDPPFLTEEDLATLPRSGASPALNGEDGFLRLPWFSIYFEGRHLYKVFAVDRNWFDLVRSIPEGGFGPGGNLGDGIDPPIFHVNGGIGLFGSASVDSTGFFIEPVE